MSREGRYVMKDVVITTVMPNHKRDFDVFPIDRDVVHALKKSFERSGDFGVIPVREIAPGRYEQACGHHRLAAMKELGHAKVAVKVAQFSDEEMRTMMIDENAARMGANPAAVADSVLATATDLAYALFVSEDLEKVSEISETFYEALSHGQSAFGQAKARAAKGDVAGNLITLCLGGKYRDGNEALKGDSPLAPSTIANALANMRAMPRTDGKRGNFLQQKIYEQKRAVDLIKKAKEEAEKQAIANAKAAAELAEQEARHLEQQRQVFLEQQARAEAAKKDKEAKEAAVKAAEAEKLAKAREEMRLKKQAEAEEKERQAEQRRILRALEAQQQREAIIAAEAAKFLAPNLMQEFKNDAQFEAFRTVVKKNFTHFPVNSQPALVKRMMSTLRTSEGKEQDPTAGGIKSYLNSIVMESNAELLRYQKERDRKMQEEAEQASIELKARRIHDELSGEIQRLVAVLAELDSNWENEAFRLAFMEVPHQSGTYGNMNTLERILPEIRGKLGVAARSITEATIVENVIN